MVSPKRLARQLDLAEQYEPLAFVLFVGTPLWLSIPRLFTLGLLCGIWLFFRQR